MNIQPYKGFLPNGIHAHGMKAQLLKKQDTIQNSTIVDNPYLHTDIIEQMVSSQFDALPKIPFYAANLSTEDQYVIMDDVSSATISTAMITNRKKWKFLFRNAPPVGGTIINFADEVQEIEIICWHKDIDNQSRDISVYTKNFTTAILKNYFGIKSPIMLFGDHLTGLSTIQQYFYYSKINCTDNETVLKTPLVQHFDLLNSEAYIIDECNIVSCYADINERLLSEKQISGGDVAKNELKLNVSNSFVNHNILSYIPSTEGGLLLTATRNGNRSFFARATGNTSYYTMVFDYDFDFSYVDFSKEISVEIPVTLTTTNSTVLDVLVLFKKPANGTWTLTSQIVGDSRLSIRSVFFQQYSTSFQITFDLTLDLSLAFNEDGDYQSKSKIVYYNVSLPLINYRISSEVYEDCIIHSQTEDDNIGGISKIDPNTGSVLSIIATKTTNCLYRHGRFNKTLNDVAEKVNCLYAPTIIYPIVGTNPDGSYIYSETPEIYRCTYNQPMAEFPFLFSRYTKVYGIEGKYNVDNFLTLASKRSQNQALATLVNVNLAEELQMQLLKRDRDGNPYPDFFDEFSGFTVTASNSVIDDGLPAQLNYIINASDNVKFKDYVKRMNPNDDFLIVERHDITELLKGKTIKGSTLFDENGEPVKLDFMENFFFITDEATGQDFLPINLGDVGCIMQNRVLPTVLSNGRTFIAEVPKADGSFPKIARCFQIWQLTTNSLTNKSFRFDVDGVPTWMENAPTSGSLQFLDLTYRYSVTSYTIL